MKICFSSNDDSKTSLTGVAYFPLSYFRPWRLWCVAVAVAVVASIYFPNKHGQTVIGWIFQLGLPGTDTTKCLNVRKSYWSNWYISISYHTLKLEWKKILKKTYFCFVLLIDNNFAELFPLIRNNSFIVVSTDIGFCLVPLQNETKIANLK